MLTWAGSKEALADWILDITVGPGVAPARVVEPYCGTCKVSIAAARRGCRSVVVNDAARGLIEVLSTVADVHKLEAFIVEVQRLDDRWQVSDRTTRRALHSEWRAKYNAFTASPAEVFCLFRSTYSGLYRENRRGKFNAPCRTTAKYDGPRRLFNEADVREFGRLAASWTIRLGEGLHVLPRPGVDETGTLVLIDPPYDGTFTGYVGGKAPSPDKLRPFAATWRNAGATVALCQPGHARSTWEKVHQLGPHELHETTRSEAFARRFTGNQDARELLAVWRPARKDMH